MSLFFSEWVECRMSQWADITRQSCKVRKCIAKTQDESLLTSKMMIALSDSITTFGFVISMEVNAEQVNRHPVVPKTGRWRCSVFVRKE